MTASGVTYSVYLNEAERLFGVDAALLYAILEFKGIKIFDLPEGAKEYARSVSRQDGTNRERNEQGLTEPKANILAAAFFLSKMYEFYGDTWLAVKIFLGDTPRAGAEAIRIQRTTFVKYKNRWG